MQCEWENLGAFICTVLKGTWLLKDCQQHKTYLLPEKRPCLSLENGLSRVSHVLLPQATPCWFSQFTPLLSSNLGQNYHFEDCSMQKCMYFFYFFTYFNHVLGFSGPAYHNYHLTFELFFQLQHQRLTKRFHVILHYNSDVRHQCRLGSLFSKPIKTIRVQSQGRTVVVSV